MSVDAGFEDLIKQFDIPFEANALAHFMEMLFAHFVFELGIVKQKVSELRSLLDQIDLGHPLGFAFELLGRNADQFGEHVAGIVEGERLIEVARKNIAFQRLICHIT